VPIDAFCDESGITKSASHCLISAAVAGTRAWATFDEEWNQVLCSFQLPYFHALEFFARKPDGSLKGNYRKLSEDDARSLARRLIEVFEARVIGLVAVVETAAFWQLDEVQRAFLTGGRIKGSEVTYEDGSIGITTSKRLASGKPNAAYFLLFQYVIHEVIAQTEKLASGTTVSLTFDEQHQFEPWAQDLSRLIRADWEYGDRIQSISFGKKTERSPLQIADLIAYTTHRHVERRADSREESVFQRLQKRLSYRYFDETQLRKVLRPQFIV